MLKPRFQPEGPPEMQKGRGVLRTMYLSRKVTFSFAPEATLVGTHLVAEGRVLGSQRPSFWGGTTLPLPLGRILTYF